MVELLIQIFPNLAKLGDEFVEAIGDTLQMILFSGAASFILGTFFGVVLIVTRKNGILQNRLIYNVLDKAINVIRSIPYLILMMMIIPLSRILMGTGIGVKGAIVPLVFGTVPFFARQIETAIAEVDKGLIEASQAMGSSP